MVTGHRADAVEAALPAIARAAGVDVEAVRCGDWSQPNGHSVLAGAARMEGPYLLVMADHIFAFSILQGLMADRPSDVGVTLAVDRRTDHPLLDPDDATWVRLNMDGRIEAIGKHIETRDAVDCGAFLATGELADAIRAAVAAGRPGSLSDGMQWLADRGRAATMDIGDVWWLDVDDARSHAQAQLCVREELPELFAAVS